MSKETNSRIRPINTENKLMTARGKGLGGWAQWVRGVGDTGSSYGREQIIGIKGTAQGISSVRL